jgi:hypothetical protein
MYTAYQIKQWESVRGKDLSHLQEAITTLAPFGGLTSNAIAHLRNDWIRWGNDAVIINVPEKDSCNSFKLEGGTCGNVPAISKRDRPCNYCRKTGNTNKFEHLRDDFGRTQGPERYTAVLHREIAESAVNFVSTVFQTYERSELSATQSGLLDAANEAMGTSDSEATINRLVRTGPVIYDHYGLEKSEIADITPFKPKTIENILYNTSKSEWKCNTAREFLKAVKRMEPVEVKELANELGRAVSSTRKRLYKYGQRGKVRSETNGSGKYDTTSPTTWSTTEEWNTRFECENCEYNDWSLESVIAHKNQDH